jgi:pyruvate/2-oxoacid:ferredoxin oxidoreductase alpha subunit
MMAVNRTLGPPWNIWVDHGDTLALRDAGWIQFYCEDNQEVHDTILAAYRLAEDARVLLPALVCQDAFVLSHTLMPTEIAEQAEVDRFLPPLELPHRLTGRPRVVGGLDYPHETEVHRRQQQEGMARVPAVYREVQDAFAVHFGRRLADGVVPYRMDDAEVVVVSMGTTGATARAAVDAARARGLRAGALRVRLFRPLPTVELARWLAGRPVVAVLDRDLSPGLGGILWSELRGAAEPRAVVQGYLVGLGGGDVRPERIEAILDHAAGLGRASEPLFVEVGG